MTLPGDSFQTPLLQSGTFLLFHASFRKAALNQGAPGAQQIKPEAHPSLQHTSLLPQEIQEGSSGPGTRQALGAILGALKEVQGAVRNTPVPMTILLLQGELLMWLRRKCPAEAWEWQELLPWAWAAEPDPSPGSATALSQTQARALRGGRAQLHASNAAKSLQIQRESRLDSSQDLPRVTPSLSPKCTSLACVPGPREPATTRSCPCYLIPVPSLSGVPSPAVRASAASSDPAVVAASSLPRNPSPARLPPRLSVSGAAETPARRDPGRMRSLGALQRAPALATSRESPLIPSILPAQLRARGRTRWPGPDRKSVV